MRTCAKQMLINAGAAQVVVLLDETCTPAGTGSVVLSFVWSKRRRSAGSVLHSICKCVFNMCVATNMCAWQCSYITAQREGTDRLYGGGVGVSMCALCVDYVHSFYTHVLLERGRGLTSCAPVGLWLMANSANPATCVYVCVCVCAGGMG